MWVEFYDMALMNYGVRVNTPDEFLASYKRGTYQYILDYWLIEYRKSLIATVG
jgi:hypothetical protein